MRDYRLKNKANILKYEKIRNIKRKLERLQKKLCQDSVLKVKIGPRKVKKPDSDGDEIGDNGTEKELREFGFDGGNSETAGDVNTDSDREAVTNNNITSPESSMAESDDIPSSSTNLEDSLADTQDGPGEEPGDGEDDQERLEICDVENRRLRKRQKLFQV